MKKEFSFEERKKELEKKYNIDFNRLEREQIKLAKELTIKDKINIDLFEKFGAIDTTFIGNKILSCIIVCNKNFDIIDKAYSFEKVKFPYLPGFRSYRELPAMVKAFNNLKERPDVVFIQGQGITHQRLGLASHFSLVCGGIPTIGISNSIINCKIENDDIIKEDKKVGKILKSKEKSNPLYISPGNNISVESAYKLSSMLIKPPHKNPEPIHLARKYLKEIRNELINK